MTELIGIAAGISVLASWFPKSERTKRIVNAIGAVLFIVYGIMIKSISVAALNGAVLINHVYNLGFNPDKEHTK